MTAAEARHPRSAAVFLDRDGVIVDLVRDPRSGVDESPYRAADVRLVAGAAAGLEALRRAGFLLIVASNQPAAAKGTVAMQELQAVHQRAVELLVQEGIELDCWRYCFHHPRGAIASLSVECSCRKPKPGLVLAAAAELGVDLARSWMVGDSTTDVEAGRSAGCGTVLVEHPGSEHRRRGGSLRPDHRAASLEVAADLIASDSFSRLAFRSRREGGNHCAGLD